MDKKQFEKIISSLNVLENRAKKVQEFTTLKPNTEDWTIREHNDYRKESASIESSMDKFVGADLYHIIGMGNLSGAQSVVLNSKVKKLTSYRSVLKFVAALPGLPYSEVKGDKEDASYIVKCTQGIVLKGKDVKNV